jgi:hypothetical protein
MIQDSTTCPVFTAQITLDLGRKFPALKRVAKVESEPLRRSGRLRMTRKIPANRHLPVENLPTAMPLAEEELLDFTATNAFLSWR